MSVKAHELIYKHLMNKRKENPDLYFSTRKRIDGNLKKGYWFLGNKNYISISFWEGFDSSNKTPNISFIVIPPNSEIISKRDGCTSFIQLTARDLPEKTQYLKRMSEKITGFQVYGKDEWNKRYRALNYLKNLDEFLENDKPLIDDMIKNDSAEGLSMLTDESLKYIKNIERIRRNR